jgi:hypothetical protein
VVSNLEDLNLKVSIFQEENARGLRLKTETSLLKSISEGYAYELTGAIITDKFEIERLVLQLELKDSLQKINTIELIPLWEESQPILQPGDAVPIKILIRDANLSPDLKEVTLKVYKIKRYEVEGKIEPDAKISTTWTTVKPKSMDVEIGERMQVIHSEPELFTHEITLSYTNKGEKHIEKLQVQLRWLNKELELIHTANVDLLNLTDPLLPPRQRRLKQEQFTIPYKLSDYLTYEIEIMTIE